MIKVPPVVHVLVQERPYITTQGGTGEEALRSYVAQFRDAANRIGVSSLQAYLGISPHHEQPNRPGVETVMRYSYSGQRITGYLHFRSGEIDHVQKRTQIVDEAFRETVSDYVSGPDGDKLIVVTPQFENDVLRLLQNLECEVVEVVSS